MHYELSDPHLNLFRRFGLPVGSQEYENNVTHALINTLRVSDPRVREPVQHLQFPVPLKMQQTACLQRRTVCRPRIDIARRRAEQQRDTPVDPHRAGPSVAERVEQSLVPMSWPRPSGDLGPLRRGSIAAT